MKKEKYSGRGFRIGYQQGVKETEKKEIEYCKYLIKRFKLGYGKCNKKSDLCIACRATKVIEFLEEHIKLLNL